ncbi:mucoidy inhibitor MuiA family protein [Leptospira perolatii]|nr:mucoidy inhibitor MuiA family protein [Leptospira perolatii]
MQSNLQLSVSLRFLLAFGMISLGASSLLAKEEKLGIKEVTVHQGTAQVLRVGKIELEPGINKVEISNLPVSLLEESLTAGTNTVNTEVSGTRTWKEEGTASSNPEVAKLQRRVHSLEKELEVLQAKENDLKSEKEVLAEFRRKVSETVGRNLLYGRVEPDGKIWATYLRRNREENVSLLASWEKIETARLKIQAELEEAQKQLRVLLSQAEKSKRITWIQVINTSKDSKVAELRISYLVPNAIWKPSYTLSTNQNFEKAQFEYIAEITQETGEDWNDVTILLSTTRPDLSQRRNRLTPLKLYDEEVRNKTEILENQAQSVGAIQTGKESEEKVRPDESSGASERGSGFLYRMPKLVTLPSQKESRKFEMLSFPIQLNIRTIASPRYKPFPLLEATFMNPGEFPLLPGSVSLFRPSGMVGTTRIPYTSPKDSVNLSLGTEGSLRLSYRTETNNTKEGIISTQKVLEKRIYLSIENFGKESKKVLIRDQIPISELASVKVEMDSEKTTPGFREYRQNSGIYEWNMEIPPSDKKEIRVEYRVLYPKDQNLYLP